MQSEIVFKNALASDESFVRRVHHDAYREVVQRQFGRWDQSDQDMRFTEKWSHGQFRIILSGPERIGALWTTDAEDSVLLNEILVLPAHQGRGFGSDALSTVLRHSDNRSVPTRLQVLKLSKARALYERLGFVVFGSSDTHFLMVRGVPESSTP